MNTFELGKYWLSRFGEVLPQSSTRVRIRLAWHLAHLNVRSDHQLEMLSDAVFATSPGKPEKLVEIRRQYLRKMELLSHRDASLSERTASSHLSDHLAGALAPLKNGVIASDPMPKMASTYSHSRL